MSAYDLYLARRDVSPPPRQHESRLSADAREERHQRAERSLHGAEPTPVTPAAPAGSIVRTPATTLPSPPVNASTPA
jgi:hypothetical protein